MIETIVHTNENGKTITTVIEYYEWLKNHIEKINYEDGKRHGYYEYLHNDGSLHVNGYYKYGKKDGVWQHLDEHGKLINKDVYKSGKWIKSEMPALTKVKRYIEYLMREYLYD